MFDPESFMLGGVQLIALVLGLVQFIKDAFNLEGKPVTFIAASLGAVIYALFELIKWMPALYSDILSAVFASILFGLAASGYYKLAKHLNSQR